MVTTISIKEYSQTEAIELSPNERHLIKTGCKNKLGLIRPLEGNGYSITSSSYIGVYNIDRYKILVEPKVPVISTFKMLCYAYDLAFFDDTYTDYENIEELFEYLIRIFQKKVARLVNDGLFANYLEQNSTLRYVKGRININESIRKDWQNNIINCDFDEYHSDVIENQIIRYTLDKLIKLQFKDIKIRRNLIITNRYFNHITFKQITLQDIANVQYTVLNSHYKTVHQFCSMILELVGIHEKEGLEKFNAYSLDMNLLFERYIGHLVKEQLQEYVVILQGPKYLDEEEDIRIKPDIVIYKDDAPQLVLDTKYKIDDSSSNSDIFQLNGYMSKLNVNGVLIYPAYEIEETTHTISPNTLSIKTFNLEDLEKSEADFVACLNVMIEKGKRIAA